MGLFDYMFNPTDMSQQGLFGNLFSDRWAPTQEAVQNGAFDPQGGNNSGMYGAPFSYSQPPQPAPQPPAQQAIQEAAPQYQPPPDYTYGGRPETNPLLRPIGQPPTPQMSQAAPQVPQAPQAQSPGIGDRLGAGLMGLVNGGSPIGGVVNLLGGLFTGQRTDPQGVQQQEMLRMYRSLQKDFGLSEPQARATIMHPELAKEVYKGLANSQPVILPDGSVAMPGQFGAAPRIVGAAPKPEIKDFYDPTTGRMMPGAITPPSAANPQMRITMPGQGPQLPGQGASPQLPGQANVGFATAPSIGEKKTQEDIAAANVVDYKGIQTQALAASNQRSVFQRMRQLNDMPGLGQGGLAPIQQAFRSAMVSLNLGDPSKVKPGEEFNSLASTLVLEATGGSLGNQISDGDRSFMAARIPQLANTKEGRAEMLQTLELISQRKIDIAKEAQKYRLSHGGDLDGFQTYIADWANKPENQLFRNRQVGTTTPALPPPPKGFVVQ